LLLCKNLWLFRCSYIDELSLTMQLVLNIKLRIVNL